MHKEINAFKKHVREISADPHFIHHQWFVKWHLEIVERIAFELYEHYPEADQELLEVMVWLHDYGKILDFDHQYELTITEGPKILKKLGFPQEFAHKAVAYIETLDKKLELDISKTPIEVQIVSSADGCSHLVGPFMYLWWYEHPEKQYEELMAGNRQKAAKDWDHKVVLPEARLAFQARHDFLYEQAGALPEKFLAA